MCCDIKINGVNKEFNDLSFIITCVDVSKIANIYGVIPKYIMYFVASKSNEIINNRIMPEKNSGGINPYHLDLIKFILLFCLNNIFDEAFP